MICCLRAEDMTHEIGRRVWFFPLFLWPRFDDFVRGIDLMIFLRRSGKGRAFLFCYFDDDEKLQNTKKT